MISFNLAKITKHAQVALSKSVRNFGSNAQPNINSTRVEVPSRIDFIDENQLHFREILHLSHSKQ